MSRRITRTILQLSALGLTCFVIALFLDSRYDVLPTAIHNHLPAHHPGLVVTDITVKQCSNLNLLSACKVSGDEWQRIEKDLFLGKSYLNTAYVWVKRKQETELEEDDKVVIDARISRVAPQLSALQAKDRKWESRSGGLWVLRSTKRHESDSKNAITSIDILYGPDATEPRPGWTLRDTPFLLDSVTKGMEPHLTARTGVAPKLERPKPRIGQHGKFKIMQLADLHLSTGVGICRDPEPDGYNGGKCEADPRTLDFVARLLDQEQPDLVVLTGDQVNGDTAPDAQTAILKLADLFIRRSIPYAAIFGNHDDEGRTPLSRTSHMTLLETLPFSLSTPGPTTLSGIGNYYLEILAPGTSHHSAMTLYLLDTHKYSPDEKNFHGYDWIKQDQIDWFRETAEGLKPGHRAYTKIHMDMAFIHIPLPEYRDPDNVIVGTWKEGVTAPTFNSHFTDALVEKGVLVVSAGHDHANDYCALKRGEKGDKHPEMWMCYGGGVGFGGYGGYDKYVRRVRFFEIDANSARVSTYKRLEWGDTEKRVDEQVVVEGGRVVAY